jgi:hypothetical protein
MLRRTINYALSSSKKGIGSDLQTRFHSNRVYRAFHAPNNSTEQNQNTLKFVENWLKVLIGMAPPRTINDSKIFKETLAQTLRSKEFWVALPHILRNQPSPEEEEKEPSFKESFYQYWKDPQNRNYSLLAIFLLVLGLASSTTIQEMTGIEFGGYRVITTTVS